MFDLVYNFLHDVLFNSSVMSQSLQDNACMILSVVVMVLITFVLIKLVVWVFNFTINKNRIRRF